MPRYFFDMHEGSSLVRDAIGLECAALKAVRLEAMKALPAIAKDVIPTEGDRQAFMVLVRDEADATVYVATLTYAGQWIGDTPLPEGEDDTFV